jgi:Tfp pilus assembly protein PilX
MFVALIVMVAMALAALALIRAVDTTTAVVGNLGFRQASILPANAAVEVAVSALFETKSIALEANDVGQNYFASKLAGDDARGVPALLGNACASGTVAKVLPADAAGNTVCYVIERMCNNPGVATGTNCDMLPPKLAAGTTVGDPSVPMPQVPFYRLTVRVDGPRHTASYVQVMLR